MKELFYFEFSDLMVNVEYIADTNSIRYASHRRMIFQERRIIEQYLLSKFALKTDYYKQTPSFLVCLGIEKKLVDSLEKFKVSGSMNGLAVSGQSIDESVHNLIHQSMKSYYAEKIGDVLIKMKDVSGDDLIILKRELQELIYAYNVYSDTQISIKELIAR